MLDWNAIIIQNQIMQYYADTLSENMFVERIQVQVQRAH